MSGADEQNVVRALLYTLTVFYLLSTLYYALIFNRSLTLDRPLTGWFMPFSCMFGSCRLAPTSSSPVNVLSTGWSGHSHTPLTLRHRTEVILSKRVLRHVYLY
jgi:hypothetical protein